MSLSKRSFLYSNKISKRAVPFWTPSYGRESTVNKGLDGITYPN